MAEIKTRPATPEYRDNWEKIFGGFRPRADGGVIRAGHDGDALFHGDSITLSGGVVITLDKNGVFYELPHA